MSPRLSVFDLHDPTRLRALVPTLERLGFSRYWTTEHHSPIQSGSPTVCVATAAALTRRMRIGAAGVMLRLRQPFAVAEEFRLLRAMHGDRIDLGVVTAVPRDPLRSLLCEDPPADVRPRLERLLEHLDGRPVPAGPGPGPGAPWSVWLCGTSPSSARMAGELGLGFAFLDHPRQPGHLDGPEVVGEYRAAFRSGITGDRPQVVLVCGGLCHPDPAQWLPLLGLPPTFLGTPSECRDSLAAVAERYDVDEIAVQSAARSFEVELASYAALAQLAGLAPARSQDPAPPAPRDPTVDRITVEVADPYRWLEDVDSPETRAWLAAQGERYTRFIGRLPRREALRDRLREVVRFERTGLPRKVGGAWFVLRSDGQRPHPVLYRHRALEEPGEVVFDPNALSTDGSVALSAYDASPDGRWLVTARSERGSDRATLRIRDLVRGVDTEDEVRDTAFCTPVFLPDGSVLYGRFADGHRAHRVWRHHLGTPQSEDRQIFASERPGALHQATVTGDGRFVGVTTTGGGPTELWVAPLHPGGELGPFRRMAGQGRSRLVGRAEGAFLVRTDAGAPRGRVVAVGDAGQTREIVPEQSEELLEASLAGGRLFCRYLRDANSEIVVHGIDGTRQGVVELPGIGTATGFVGADDETETFFTFTSFTAPATVYRYDLRTGRSTPLAPPRLPFDPTVLHTDRIVVPSRDGTPIPAFVCWSGASPRDGERPTLLSGYGGFGLPLTPRFDPLLVPWFEGGGVLVVANVRGGGEFGRAWHEAGTKAGKIDACDDLIAVAEHLVASGRTSPRRLALFGHSNGGLLVGAALVRRPELFGAAVPSAGVFDLLRFHRWTVGHTWTAEYGSVDVPAEAKALLDLSPLHGARPACYPPTLVLAADQDDRVVPVHSYKFCAALQHAQRGAAPVLLRLEQRGGHGASRPLARVIEERADLWAFLLEVLGPEVS